MFKRTKRRLVILNALVFFILQNLLGGMVYVYTRYSLYQQVDQSILEKKDYLIHDRDDLIENDLNPNRDQDHRLVYLLWDKDGNVCRIIPTDASTAVDIQSFSKLRDTHGMQSVTINSVSYRYVNLPVSNSRSPSIQSVQIIYNLQRENDMLNHLLMVIGFGSLLSVFIAILAGIYLANKALVPIKKSWEKQQQFVTDASHELRTPLSVMKLNLEHLFRHPGNSIEQESETIHQVIQEINYLAKMTADLLTLARSDSNQLEVMKEPLDLDNILGHVVKHFKSLAVVKDIKIDDEISPIRMMGDRERLKQLFIILLDNALKYTKEQGTIMVRAGMKNSRITIEISDTGIGIRAEDLPYIFDRYYRGDKSRTRHVEGSGLGLSIAQWIVHSHGGKIRVTSKEGEGTQMVISFLLKHPPTSEH